MPSNIKIPKNLFVRYVYRLIDLKKKEQSLSDDFFFSPAIRGKFQYISPKINTKDENLFFYGYSRFLSYPNYISRSCYVLDLCKFNEQISTFCFFHFTKLLKTYFLERINDDIIANMANPEIIDNTIFIN